MEKISLETNSPLASQEIQHLWFLCLPDESNPSPHINIYFKINFIAIHLGLDLFRLSG